MPNRPVKSKNSPCYGKNAVYTHIITELTNIIDNNKLVVSSATKGGGEASIEAVKALLAKTYLSAAWDLKKDDYFTKAAAYATKLLPDVN
mgnify:CR=1 FL=1